MTKLLAENCFKDYVILVTGAGNGIGSAVAKAYAHHGATIILLDKLIPALEQTYDDIVLASSPTPAIYPLDLKGASLDDYQTLIETIEGSFGRLDGLVHCAASLGQLAPLVHQDPKTWLETLHINLTAPYMLTRACLPLMQQQSNAAIIFSTDNHKNKAYWAAYGVSKAAIEALAAQLADELETNGRIRVNCIDPGSVQTQLHARAFPAIDPTPLAKPEDVTEPYLQLMAKDNSVSDGQIIQAQ